METRCPFLELLVDLFKRPHEYVSEVLDIPNWQFNIHFGFDFREANLPVGLIWNVELLM